MQLDITFKKHKNLLGATSLKFWNSGTIALNLGSPILIVVSVIYRDQCIYYLYYVFVY